MTNIVTRDSLVDLLNKSESKKVEVIGRALVAIFKRQTEVERSANTTNVNNFVGFSGADAQSGSITAKYYIKHKNLLDWQVEKWMKPANNGYPRICKYWQQLDEIAKAKQA